VQCDGGYSATFTAYIDGVIVRVLAARVSEQNAGEFNNLLRKQLDELRDQPGLVYAKLARRLGADGAEEVMLFEEWRRPMICGHGPVAASTCRGCSLVPSSSSSG
jgi:hypothetical protein